MGTVYVKTQYICKACCCQYSIVYTMVRLHLCGIIILCVWLCIDITEGNKEKAKKAAKKLKTKKKKTPGWVVGVIVVVVIVLLLGIAGFIYYRKKKNASYDEAPVSDTNQPA